VKAILFIWQLPQLLLGYFLIHLLRANETVHICADSTTLKYFHFERKGRFSQFISGVSLGWITLLSDNASEATIRHEWGHSKQSLYLGWLYLLIVGIYSAVFCNLWDRWLHKDWHIYDRYYWYYKTRWTEGWADRLGKVDRDAWLMKRYPAHGGTRYQRLMV